MDFFKKKYPDKIFDISLEYLTNNKEEVSKNIFNFCNIKWNSNVLGFIRDMI